MLFYSNSMMEHAINETYNVLTRDLNFTPDCIVGLKRGGLVPAVYLSHAFNVNMECLTWSTRDFVSDIHNETVAQLIEQGAKVLIVDDINDSGKTLDQVQRYYDPQRKDTVKYVTLISKKHSIFAVDYAAQITDSDEWIVFPWEEIE